MPAPRPEEFRRRAVELARLRGKTIAQIAKDLGIAESGLRVRTWAGAWAATERSACRTAAAARFEDRQPLIGVSGR